MAGTLYVVATPLGNLGDVSDRLRAVLGAVPVVYAEDTRVTRVLLQHLGVRPRLLSLHNHNERARTAAVLQHLADTDDVALVSDAGTPAISDPGAYVVAAAHAAGYPVVPVPGPSAAMVALSAAGFPIGAGHAARVVGFLPAAGSARTAAITELAAMPDVAVVFESPRRAQDLLAHLSSLAPTREACWCRELTKQFEEVRRGTLPDLAALIAGAPVRGEVTVVLGPGAVPEAAAADDAALCAAVRRCLTAGLSARDAATAVAAVLALPRRRVYQRALSLVDSDEPGS